MDSQPHVSASLTSEREFTEFVELEAGWYLGGLGGGGFEHNGKMSGTEACRLHHAK